MTKFEALENNYVALTEAEMMETEGGVAPFIITGAMVLKGIAAFGGGVTVGKMLAGK